MARPGVGKGDVQRARLSLMRAGKHPSIDAIRIELGNTGSKATIYRHLKEIEADEGGGGLPQASVSEELQAFVTSLAGRLEYESQERIDLLKAGHAQQIKHLTEALERAQAEAHAARHETERSQVDLSREKAARQRAEADLQALRLEHHQQVGQLGAQLEGLHEQLKAAQAHAASLEEKHAHAREALEHFRTASREQRDREARQHEQQLQYLQKEVSVATDALTAKHAELRSALQERADALAQLTGARAEKRQLEELLRDLKPVSERLAAQTQVVEALRAQAAQATQQYEALLARATDLGQRNLELERLLAAAGASAHAQEQLVQEVLSRISKPVSGKVRSRADAPD